MMGLFGGWVGAEQTSFPADVHEQRRYSAATHPPASQRRAPPPQSPDRSRASLGGYARVRRMRRGLRRASAADREDGRRGLAHGTAPRRVLSAVGGRDVTAAGGARGLN